MATSFAAAPTDLRSLQLGKRPRERPQAEDLHAKVRAVLESSGSLTAARPLCSVIELLDQPEGEGIHNAFGEALAVRLLDFFLDPGQHALLRRWSGILLFELCRRSNQTTNLFNSKHAKLRLKGLGRVVQLREDKEDLMLVACMIMSQLAVNGLAQRLLWSGHPPAVHLGQDDHRGWIVGLQNALDTFSDSQTSQTAIFYPREIWAGRERLFDEQKGRLLMLIEDHLTVVIAPPAAAYTSYLDIPFECIRAVTVISDVELDLGLHCANDTWTYVVNATPFRTRSITMEFAAPPHAEHAMVEIKRRCHFDAETCDCQPLQSVRASSAPMEFDGSRESDVKSSVTEDNREPQPREISAAIQSEERGPCAENQRGCATQPADHVDGDVVHSMASSASRVLPTPKAPSKRNIVEGSGGGMPHKLDRPSEDASVYDLPTDSPKSTITPRSLKRRSDEKSTRGGTCLSGRGRQNVFEISDDTGKAYKPARQTEPAQSASRRLTRAAAARQSTAAKAPRAPAAHFASLEKAEQLQADVLQQPDITTEITPPDKTGKTETHAQSESPTWDMLQSLPSSSSKSHSKADSSEGRTVADDALSPDTRDVKQSIYKVARSIQGEIMVGSSDESDASGAGEEYILRPQVSRNKGDPSIQMRVDRPRDHTNLNTAISSTHTQETRLRMSLEREAEVAASGSPYMAVRNDASVERAAHQRKSLMAIVSGLQKTTYSNPRSPNQAKCSPPKTPKTKPVLPNKRSAESASPSKCEKRQRVEQPRGDSETAGNSPSLDIASPEGDFGHMSWSYRSPEIEDGDQSMPGISDPQTSSFAGSLSSASTSPEKSKCPEKQKVMNGNTKSMDQARPNGTHVPESNVTSKVTVPPTASQTNGVYPGGQEAITARSGTQAEKAFHVPRDAHMSRRHHDTAFSTSRKKCPVPPQAESRAITLQVPQQILHASVLLDTPAHPPSDPFSTQTAMPDGPEGETRFMRNIRKRLEKFSEQQQTLNVDQCKENGDGQCTLVDLVGDEGQKCGLDVEESSSVVSSGRDRLDRTDEHVEWERSLEPHQRDIFDVLTRISRRFVRHLINSETAIQDVIDDYKTDGSYLIEQMEMEHRKEYDAQRKRLAETRLQMSDSLCRIRDRIADQRKQAVAASSGRGPATDTPTSGNSIAQLEDMLRQIPDT